MGAEGVNPRLAQHFTGATSFLVVKLISDTIASVASSILLLHIACQLLYYSKTSNHGRESVPPYPAFLPGRLDQTDNNKNNS
jgi:hypothetical protein